MVNRRPRPSALRIDAQFPCQASKAPGLEGIGLVGGERWSGAVKMGFGRVQPAVRGIRFREQQIDMAAPVPIADELADGLFVEP